MMRCDTAVFALLALLPAAVLGLDNGLALTPPMGWMTWERFRCNTDCVNDPDFCISEWMFRNMTDRLAEDGYLEAGYEYIIMDDCWLSHERDSVTGKLQPDPDRFPSGIKALADYVHSKGVKFGLYEDYGTHTCGGYPGILGHLALDAQTFAEWEVDYVKLDGCYADPTTMHVGYPEFGQELNKTGRPMVYSCSWPAYMKKEDAEWDQIAENCNIWRLYDDVQDSWDSVSTIFNYWGDNQDLLQPLAGPGHFNDADMLIVGDFGLSLDQSRAQMALWAILATPMLMSVDLRDIRPEFKEILLNKDIIAVSQDPLGIQGSRVYQAHNQEVWTRPVSPANGDSHSYAVAFLSRRTDGTPSPLSTTLKDIGLTDTSGYQCQDLYTKEKLDVLLPSDTIQVEINPDGVVMMKCTLVMVGSEAWLADRAFLLL